MWDVFGGGATEWSVWKILVHGIFGSLMGFMLLLFPLVPLNYLYEKSYPRIIKRQFYKRFQGLEAAEKAFMSGRAWRYDPFMIQVFGEEDNPYKAGHIKNEVVQSDLETEWEKGRAFRIKEDTLQGSVIFQIILIIVIALLIFSIKSFMHSDWVWAIVTGLVAIVISAYTARGLYNPATGEALAYKKWLLPNNYYKFMRIKNPYQEAETKQDDV